MRLALADPNGRQATLTASDLAIEYATDGADIDVMALDDAILFWAPCAIHSPATSNRWSRFDFRARETCQARNCWPRLNC